MADTADRTGEWCSVSSQTTPRRLGRQIWRARRPTDPLETAIAEQGDVDGRMESVTEIIDGHIRRRQKLELTSALPNALPVSDQAIENKKPRTREVSHVSSRRSNKDGPP